MRRHPRGKRTQFLSAPGQLELPLDYSQSVCSAPSRSHESLTAKRARRSRAALAISRANRARPYSVPASTSPVIANFNEIFCQGQRKPLTSTIGTIITEVNEYRAPRSYLMATPPASRSATAQTKLRPACSAEQTIPARRMSRNALLARFVMSLDDSP
jgi:hypothetical protein